MFMMIYGVIFVCCKPVHMDKEAWNFNCTPFASVWHTMKYNCFCMTHLLGLLKGKGGGGDGGWYLYLFMMWWCLNWDLCTCHPWKMVYYLPHGMCCLYRVAPFLFLLRYYVCLEGWCIEARFLQKLDRWCSADDYMPGVVICMTWWVTEKNIY